MVIGQTLNRRYRFFSKLATRVVKALKEKESAVMAAKDSDALLYAAVCDHITPLDNTAVDPVQSLFYLGQDAVFARYFTRHTDTLADILLAFFQKHRPGPRKGRRA